MRIIGACLITIVGAFLTAVVIACFCLIARSQKTYAEAAPAVAASDFDAKSELEFKSKVKPLLQTYCYQCHGDGVNTGGLALDSYDTVSDVLSDAKTWDQLYRYVRGHEMPPSSEPQPTDAERKVITQWVDAELDHYYGINPDPGRVTLRRLNHSEYDNTIRDLVGIDSNFSDEFPADDTGYGFDDIGDVLSVPPLLMEKYLSAADQIMDRAMVTHPAESHTVRTLASAANIAYYAVGERGDGWVGLASTDDQYVGVNTHIAQSGEYIIRALAFVGQDKQARPGNGGGAAVAPPAPPQRPVTLSFMVGNRVVGEVEVNNYDDKNPKTYEVHVQMTPDDHEFRAVVRRLRGGVNENFFAQDGRPGRDQKGVVYVRYLDIDGPQNCATRSYPAISLPHTGLGMNTPDGWHVLKSEGEVGVSINVPKDGDYIFRAEACASRVDDTDAQMEFRANGKPFSEIDVVSPTRRQFIEPTANAKSQQGYIDNDFVGNVPQMYEARTTLKAGKNFLSAAFLNPASDPGNPNPDLKERSLWIRSFQVTALNEPLPPKVTEPIARIFAKHQAPIPGDGAGLNDSIGEAARANDAAFADPNSTEAKSAAREILGDFASSAWRRPVDPKDLDRLMSLYESGTATDGGFADGVKLAMKAALVSPHFIYLYEPRPDPNDPKAVHEIDEYALATRLSYFLWSTTPDQELLDLAAKNQLRQNLSSEVKRMLESPKSHEFVVNFASQWLQFRGIETLQPDKRQYPDFDYFLRVGLQQETEDFFEYVMRQDRSIMDFIDGDYTFVNSRLAKYYNLPVDPGEAFVKVSLDGTPRRGVVTQGSVLLVTSNPNRTSPVKRGKWVLENLLGSPPPPPPANVPALDSSKQLTGTLRQRMEQHRANPLCASCHAMMDPIGFGLENFDGIGEYRAVDDNGVPIDASGKLATGEKFNGAAELTVVFSSSHKDDFVSTIGEKMLTYALGRGVEYYDRAAIDQIVDKVEKNDLRFSSLVSAVIESVPFQMERGEAAKTSSAGSAE